MIDYAMYCKMMHLRQHDGLSAAQIADALAVDVRTVRKWFVRKGFAPRTGIRRASKLDPFKRDIGRLLEAHPYSASQIYQRICQQALPAATPSSRNSCARSGRCGRAPEPRLKCRVVFNEHTWWGHLRAPVFKKLLE